jgi:hypothetical protein
VGDEPAEAGWLTARGSLPTIDPSGRPVANSEPVWAILPFFDRNRNGVLDVVQAQARGQAGPDTPTNVRLFFDSEEVQPQPASSSGRG